jgi:hypothetical protein
MSPYERMEMKYGKALKCSIRTYENEAWISSSKEKNGFGSGPDMPRQHSIGEGTHS